MRKISILDILDETVSRLPDKTYLQDEEEAITYSQCKKKAMRLGYALYKELSGARNRPIMLFMDKSCRCIVSMLGVLYSGNFYVPMDTKTPLDRLESILETLNNAVILTTAKDFESLRKIAYPGDALVCEDLLAKWHDNVVEDTVQAIRDTIIDTDLMYVLFTSGSTGTPKGVAAMHRSVIDYIESSIKCIGIEEGDIVGNQGPFYTDIPLRDAYMVLKAGATACLIPQKFFISPKKLLQYLDNHNVTNLMWVPTAYRLVSQFEALSKVKPRSLRKLLFVGEPIPIPVFQYWKKNYPDAEYRQLYGPSEVTGVCTYYRITRDYESGETIPVGKPFPNTGILLLDDEDHEIAPSNIFSMGEVCVYGTCLTAGYYNEPEKTKKVFVQNPTITAYPSLVYRTGDIARYDSEGNLVFVSRKDYQIKHGGRRVELGEVETAFQAVEGLKAVCCVHNRREDKLVLYYIGEVPEEKMSQTVSSRLPKYMVPSIYHKVDELPLLSNGKLDRKMLDGFENN